MSAVVFLAGFVIGSVLSVAVAVVWHGRCHTAHFQQLLDQVKSLGPRQ